MFKVVLIGPSKVGKTSFIKRITTGEYSEEHIATVGVNVYPVNVNVGKDYCLNIWDCAGDKRYGVLNDGYYLNSDAAIVMIENSTPISETENILRMYKRMCPGSPIVVVVNKHDEVSESHNYDSVVITSCKNDIGLNRVLATVLSKLL